MPENDKPKSSGRRYVITRDIDSPALWKPWLDGKAGRRLPDARIFKLMRKALDDALVRSLALEKRLESSDYEIAYWGKGESFKFHPFRRNKDEFICSLDPVVVSDYDCLLTTTRVW